MGMITMMMVMRIVDADPCENEKKSPPLYHSTHVSFPRSVARVVAKTNDFNESISEKPSFAVCLLLVLPLVIDLEEQ